MLEKIPPTIVISGTLSRDCILTSDKKMYADVPGGSLFYTAAGLSIWGYRAGLLSSIGEDYPRNWISILNNKGFDTQGIKTFPQKVDHRSMKISSDIDKTESEDPAIFFSQLGIPFPKSLIGYKSNTSKDKYQEVVLTSNIHNNDLPEPYYHAISLHLCPDSLSNQILLSSMYPKNHLNNLFLRPLDSYMNPKFLEMVHALIKDVTILITSESNLCSLFSGISTNKREMLERLGSYGCQIIIITRKSQGQFVYEHATQKYWEIPAYPIKPMDITGAGDSFCGGVIAGYLKTFDPIQAALHGNISASITLEGIGPFYTMDILPGLPQARLETISDYIIIK